MRDFPEQEWIPEDGEKWTREEFLDKMEWEGGFVGMALYSWAAFPPSLRDAARQLHNWEVG